VSTCQECHKSGADLAVAFLVACLGLDFKCTVPASIVVY